MCVCLCEGMGGMGEGLEGRVAQCQSQQKPEKPPHVAAVFCCAPQVSVGVLHIVVDCPYRRH